MKPRKIAIMPVQSSSHSEAWASTALRRRRPEDEEAGQGHHVDDHDLLEPEAVGDLADAVADHHQADLPVDGGEGRDGATARTGVIVLAALLEARRRAESGNASAGAGGRARRRAGRRGSSRRWRSGRRRRRSAPPPARRATGRAAGEEQPGEDEEVFDPLPRPAGLDRGAQRRAPGGRLARPHVG